MQARVQTYKNTEGKQAFKVVAPYMEGHVLKSKIKKFNPSTDYAAHQKPRQAAQEAANAYCAKINETGHNQFFTEYTIKDGIDPYISSKQHDYDNGDLSKKELDNYKYQCNELIAKTDFANKPMKDLVADDLKTLISDLRDIDCSNDKIRRCLFNAKGIVDVCMSKNIVNNNKLRTFKWKQRKRNVKQVELVEIPSNKDLESLDKNSTGVYNAIVNTVPWMGCRWQDWAALRWSDIGWNSNRITISKFIKNVDGQFILADYGKTDAANREIPLFAKISQKLRKWQMDPESCDEYVFGKNGSWIVYETFRRHFIKLKEKSNCKYHGGVHSFRHYYASFLIDAKVHSNLEIASFIGHEDPGFTMKRYAKCFKDHDKWVKNIDKVDKLIA